MLLAYCMHKCQNIEIRHSLPKRAHDLAGMTKRTDALASRCRAISSLTESCSACSASRGQALVENARKSSPKPVNVSSEEPVYATCN